MPKDRKMTDGKKLNVFMAALILASKLSSVLYSKEDQVFGTHNSSENENIENFNEEKNEFNDSEVFSNESNNFQKEEDDEKFEKGEQDKDESLRGKTLVAGALGGSVATAILSSVVSSAEEEHEENKKKL